ncbi:uncharacterized protein TNCV_3861371 [Trichonephila clavipes]|nr:uncharacterized protein TNCV_3861371 [Trichonephila clavipes]
MRNTLEKKIDSVEEKIALKVEEKIAVVDEMIEKNVGEEIERIKEQVEERIKGQVEERIKEQVEERIKGQAENLEKKLLACGKTTNENKSVPASAVPVPTSPVSVKLYTYDGKTNWGGEAAEVLQILTDTELLNLNSLYNALDLRFSQKFSKDYAHLQMKTRHQKPEESLQEYAFEMQRLTTLAFSDFSANVQEMISFEYFVDGLKDEEIQMAVRMADSEDLKSALLYALKVETAIQASCIDRHSIQEARVTADKPCEFRCIKGIEKLKEEMQALIAERQNRRRRSITCWGCGESGHLRSNYPQNNKKDHSTKC